MPASRLDYLATMSRPPTRIAVLGAGLQGTCVALELARRGCAVDLVDQDAVPLNRASLRNEGKIHLGLVYANDATLRTARSVLRGALTFHRLLYRWTRGGIAGMTPSATFHYLVPANSLRSPRELAAHYEAVQSLYEEEVSRGDADYLGSRPARLWWPLPAPAYAPFVASDRVIAGFGTVEASIPLERVTTLLRRSLAGDPAIRLRMAHRVAAVRRTASGFTVEGSVADGSPWTIGCDQVVNALWDGRLAIDQGFGLAPERGWVHRLKYRVMVALPERLHGMPSLTFALGAYGDVAVYGTDHAYVSWYPECLRGWSTELEPPRAWEAACTGELTRPEQMALAQRVLGAFDELVPGLAQAHVHTVDAGVIFAWGSTDITDPVSEFHRRDQIGVRSVDGYHSVNTGKLTTAPLFAFETAHRIASTS